MVVEIHVKRAGEQAAGFQGGAQASGDGVLEELAIGLVDFLGRLAPQQGGIDFHQHRNPRILGGLEIIEGNVRDAPDGDAAEFHGSGLDQPADGLVEEQDEFHGGIEGGFVRRVFVGEQGERRTIRRRRPRHHALGHAEGRAAGDHRLERRGPDFETIRPGADVDAAGVPETGVFFHQGAVFRADEGIVGDSLAFEIELAAFNPPDFKAAVINRGSRGERARLLGGEDEATAGDVAIGRQRRLQAFEVMDHFAIRRAGVELDVGAGDQGPEARDIGGGNPRPHDPEIRPVSQQAPGIRIEFKSHDDRFQILRQSDLLDESHPDRAAANLRFLRPDSVRRVEADVCDRALRADAAVNHPAADHERQNGNHPDDVPALRRPQFRCGGGR